MPNRWLVEEGTVIDPLTSLVGWTCPAGSITIEQPPMGGSPTLCLTSNTGADVDARRSTPAFSIPAGYVLGMTVYSNSPAYYADGQIRQAGFGMNNGISNYWQWAQTQINPNSWDTVFMPWHPDRDGGAGAVSGTGSVYVGTGNRNQVFDQIWLRMRGWTGVVSKTWIKDLRLYKARPCVTITIDDGHKSNVDMLAVLDQFGLKAGLAIITGSVGAADYMTRQDLENAVASGHELYPHSVSHLNGILNQSGVSLQQVTDEVGNCIETLDSWFGKRLSHRLYVSPYGERGATYDAGILAAGARLVMSAATGKNAPKLGAIGPTVPSLYRHLVYSSSNTHATNRAHLLDAIGRQSMLCLGYHYYSAGAYSGSSGDLWVSPTRLKQMIGELLSMQNVCPTVLMSDWYREVTS